MCVYSWRLHGTEAYGQFLLLLEFVYDEKVFLHKGATGPVIKLPGAPPNWSAPARKEAKGEPLFTKVDNPGGCDEFTYCPEIRRKATSNMASMMCYPLAQATQPWK
jgi:hypothetical protein